MVFIFIFLSIYFGSCGKLSWLNCQLSSAHKYMIITLHYLFFLSLNLVSKPVVLPQWSMWCSSSPRFPHSSPSVAWNRDDFDTVLDYYSSFFGIVRLRTDIDNLLSNTENFSLYVVHYFFLAGELAASGGLRGLAIDE